MRPALRRNNRAEPCRTARQPTWILSSPPNYAGTEAGATRLLGTDNVLGLQILHNKIRSETISGGTEVSIATVAQVREAKMVRFDELHSLRIQIEIENSELLTDLA